MSLETMANLSDDLIVILDGCADSMINPKFTGRQEWQLGEATQRDMI